LDAYYENFYVVDVYKLNQFFRGLVKSHLVIG